VKTVQIRFINGALTAVCGGLLIAALTSTSPASATSTSTTAMRASRLSHCHPAAVAGSGGLLGGLKTVCQVASTVPTNGDVNPYGLAVVPATVGGLVAGDVLVSNFNNSHNLQGTGATIMEISPSGTASLFANLAEQTKGPVGLTTALSVFADGYVVVGSLPTTDGNARTAKAGALYVLNSHGRLVETIRGANINGPWDMASYDGGGFASLLLTNVLNDTVAGRGSIVRGGDVVRLVLDLTTSPPTVLQRTVIASGFKEKTDPNALVIGPTAWLSDRTGPSMSLTPSPIELLQSTTGCSVTRVPESEGPCPPASS